MFQVPSIEELWFAYYHISHRGINLDLSGYPDWDWVTDGGIHPLVIEGI